MVHLAFLAIIAIANVFVWGLVKNMTEEKAIGILHRLGIIMLIAEVFKQIFCYHYVFDRTINLWFFPWQLCSMPMYLSFVIRYLKEDRQDMCLVYLVSYSLFADIVALLLPYDMLRDQVLLAFHSFIYHGLIISEAIIALHVLSGRKGVRFAPSILLFLLTAFVAETINVLSHQFLNDIHREPDMFYITPYYPTTQPVFHDIAVNYGTGVEIVIYLSSIILCGYLFFHLEKKLIFKDKKR